MLRFNEVALKKKKKFSSLTIFFLWSYRNISQEDPGVPGEEEKGAIKETLAQSEGLAPPPDPLVYIGQDVNVALCWILRDCLAMFELLYGCLLLLPCETLAPSETQVPHAARQLADAVCQRRDHFK